MKSDLLQKGKSEMSNKQEQIDLAYKINKAVEQFWALVNQRYEDGAKEYGHLTFLDNDVVRMMLEEFADVVNYCMMASVKLLILQEAMEEALGEEPEGVTMGVQAFKGTKDVGWSK